MKKIFFIKTKEGAVIQAAVKSWRWGTLGKYIEELLYRMRFGAVDIDFGATWI
jgi:hypothetical protein